MSQPTNGPAPALRVPQWIDRFGAPRDPLTLSELGDGYKLLFCFQAWCKGCHDRGFPAMKKLVDALEGKGFGFAVIQTTFEGEEENTPDKLKEMQDKYDLRLPFGHDQVEGAFPTIMQDYRTGGTPWFILIDPAGNVVHNHFEMDAEKLIEIAPTLLAG